MTRDEIVALEAGRELDALVAEKVMGWQWYHWKATSRNVIMLPSVAEAIGGVGERVLVMERLEGREYSHNINDLPPAFSTDIAAAWQVVEEMGRRGFWCVVKTPFAPEDEDKWGHSQHAGFTPHGFTGWNGRADYRAAHELLPVAICHAALIALAYYPELPPE